MSCTIINNFVTVHGVHRSSSDRRDIPVPPHGTAGLENPAYRDFVVPVNGYRRSLCDCRLLKVDFLSVGIELMQDSNQNNKLKKIAVLILL